MSFEGLMAQFIQSNHGLKSQNWYWSQPMVFNVNIVNIGHQYSPDIGRYYRVNIVSGTPKSDMISP